MGYQCARKGGTPEKEHLRLATNPLKSEEAKNGVLTGQGPLTNHSRGRKAHVERIKRKIASPCSRVVRVLRRRTGGQKHRQADTKDTQRGEISNG